MKKDVLLNVENLIVEYVTDYGVVEAVNDVSFQVYRGETLGLVGETGAGKTTTALSILRLTSEATGKVISAKIELDGEDLMQKSKKQMRRIRGNKVSMIFQDPMTSLNPVVPIGKQIEEVIRLHHHCSAAERVVIAMALVCNPELLIADEPTTALDVTIQAQILSMMRDLKKDFNTSMLLITHDLGVVAETCDRVAIMYAGEIVECGSLADIFENAQHPYTIGLFNSIPSLTKEMDRLEPIPGLMPDPMNLGPYCSFADRCPYATERCRTADPAAMEISEGHMVKCFRIEGTQEVKR